MLSLSSHRALLERPPVPSTIQGARDSAATLYAAAKELLAMVDELSAREGGRLGTAMLAAIERELIDQGPNGEMAIGQAVEKMDVSCHLVGGEVARVIVTVRIEVRTS
jgi:hypothetical protein